MTASTAARTPGPWSIVDLRAEEDDDTPPAIYVESHGIGHIGQIETIEDAQFIITACNAYDANRALITELSEVLLLASRWVEYNPPNDTLNPRITAVLTRLEMVTK